MSRTEFEGKFFKITHTVEEEGPHPSMLQDHYFDIFTASTILQGGGTCYVEGNAYPLSPGDIVLLGSDELHSFRFEQKGIHERISLYFSSALLSPFWEYELPLMQPFCAHAPGVGNKYAASDYDSARAARIFAEMCRVMESETEAPALKEAKLHLLLLELLFLLYDAFEKFSLPNPKQESDSVIRDICKYIQDNLSEKLTYEHLQDKFLVSRYQLTEIFRRNTGMSLTEYILQKRLLKVISLVRNGTGIERAAFQAGFRNYSHFYKEFVKHKNISPQKYFRRSNNESRNSNN